MEGEKSIKSLGWRNMPTLENIKALREREVSF